MPDSLSLTKRSGWLFWQARVVDIIRTIAAYLGVAVLVSVLMIASVPTLRGQASMLQQAIFATLVFSAQDVDPDSVIDLAVVKPEVKPIDLVEVPGRLLARPRPPSSQPDPEPPIERTEPMGLLGNIRVDRIDESMAHFGLTRAQLNALENYVARKYMVGKDVIRRLTETVMVASKELDVNPVLMLAVMSVESRFNPYAESGAGAQGLMQVMTRVHTDKFEKLGQGVDAAFHPQHNIRVGAQILSDCIRRGGSVDNGLRCYVGATGPDDGGYSSKVMAEQRRMALAAKIALPR